MPVPIQHKAFIDLETGLSDRARSQWRGIWRPLRSDLERAIKSKDWHRVERLIDSLDTDSIITRCATYAQTIGLSSLLLGASRLTSIKDSQVAKHPPLKQLSNGLVQWGNVVSRNMPVLLKQKLHRQVAQHEHDLEQARHEIAKTGNPYHDEKGRFASADQVGGVSELGIYRPFGGEHVVNVEELGGKDEVDAFKYAITPVDQDQAALDKVAGSHSAFRQINDYLRSGNTEVDPDGFGEVLSPDDLHASIAAIDAQIQRNTLPAPYTVFRGVKNPAVTFGVEAGRDPTTLVGTVFSDKAFVPTSFDGNIAKDFAGDLYRMGEPQTQDSAVIKLELPQGMHASVPDSTFWRERMLLLPRDTKFKITEVKPIWLPSSVGKPENIKSWLITAVPQLGEVSKTGASSPTSHGRYFVWGPGDVVIHARPVRKESEMEMEKPDDAEDEDPEELDDKEVSELLDSVEVDGSGMLSLAASLMVSRLSSFGFLVEAQDQGIEKYEISAVLDDHTCAVCEVMNGQVFSVSDGVAQASAIMDAEDPDSLRSIAPWPSQSKASVSDLADSDTQDLVDQGLALPPYHGSCRCITVEVDESASPSTASADQAESQAASEVLEDRDTHTHTDRDIGAAAATADVPSLSLGTLTALLSLVAGAKATSAAQRAPHDDSIAEEDQEQDENEIDGEPDDEDADSDDSDDGSADTKNKKVAVLE